MTNIRLSLSSTLTVKDDRELWKAGVKPLGTEIGEGKKEIIHKLIPGLFINTSKLSKMYVDDNVSKLVKKLK